VIHALGTQRFRVVNVVDVDEMRTIARDLEPRVVEQLEGLLQVEPAD
jgi:hypothetical protein